MMAYDSQFVICVLHNGRVLRESNSGTIHMPFDSEYKVRLKNKHRFLRAKARVSIDGREVSNLGDFILQPGETLDLERFLDHSMTDGHRFKFVPLSDGRVADPTDHENGFIKVEFYREVERRPLPRPPIRRARWDDSVTCKNLGSSVGSRGSSNYTHTVTNVEIPTSGPILGMNCVTPISSTGEAGATVEGGHSGQSFVYGDTFETETYPVTLTLRLRGIERFKWEYDVNGRPTPRKRRIKFCPGCGARRRNLEKFCAECGTAFHPRYEREVARGRESDSMRHDRELHKAMWRDGVL